MTYVQLFISTTLESTKFELTHVGVPIKSAWGIGEWGGGNKSLDFELAPHKWPLQSRHFPDGFRVKHVVGSCLSGSPGGIGGRELSTVVKIYPDSRL